ncbi:MAG: DUF2179 domain-containing protein [Candidatus Auribacterota bacterium]|jgi:uncharacterized protein YebE (UPF0316 family)|nr:DUF2179 domain-containing protein [Candidatus Auribacterota bacterium]
MNAVASLFGDYAIIVIPVLIFLARIIDVSIGTIRIIFISKGLRIMASVLGFFEVLIWLIAMREIMANLNNPINFVAYAAGFGAGNYFGISIERKLSIGVLMIRIITQQSATQLVSYLRDHGYGVTSIDAQGSLGPVKVVFTVIRRSELDTVRKIILRFNPKAFYTIEDVKYVSEHNPAMVDARINIFRKWLSNISIKRK